MNIFRKATPSDQTSIQKLFNDVALSVQPAAMFNWTPKTIADEFEHGAFYINIYDDAEIIAFIAYRETSDNAEIMALGTAIRYLKQGYMVELLTHFVQNFSKTGKSIHLEVHSANEKAIALYKKCGFETLKIRKSYYADGADGWVMHYNVDCL